MRVEFGEGSRGERSSAETQGELEGGALPGAPWGSLIACCVAQSRDSRLWGVVVRGSSLWDSPE